MKLTLVTQLNVIEVADDATHLDLSNRELTELPEGLEKLTYLESLFLDNNQLSTVVLKGLNNLKYLHLSNNQLSTVDLKGLNHLKYLDLNNNRLTPKQIAEIKGYLRNCNIQS